jgi:prevent-host-death family protein
MDMRVAEFAVAEAKARFSELLSRAESGETITIKRHGVAVATLGPVAIEDGEAARKQHLRAFIDWVRENPAEPLRAGETYKDFIDAGRR